MEEKMGSSQSAGGVNRDAEGLSQTEREKRAFLWEVKGIGLVIAAGALLIGFLLLLIYIQKARIKAERAEAEGQRAESVTPVVVTELKAETVVDAIHLPGRIEAWTAVDVPAEVAGQVVRARGVPVEDGTRLKKGQPILLIEQKDYQIALKEAEAQRHLAQQNFRRTAELVKKGVRTPSELDQDKTALDRAEATYDAAQLALTRCTIRSPLDGMVDDVLPEVGEFIAAGTKVASVLEVDRVKVEIAIPEKDIDTVRRIRESGDDVVVRIDAVKTAPDRPLTVKGKCTYLSLQPAEQAYVYLMRLALDNKNGRLRPGMFAEATIVRGVRPGSIIAPLFAVLARGEEHFVYVAEAQAASANLTPTDEKPKTEAKAEASADKSPVLVARLRKVKLGILLGMRVEIVSGLAPNEKLIVMGQRTVEDGALVRIVRMVDDVAELSR